MSVQLDTFQRAVVEAPPDCSLLVHACAGSGKSTTLALRAKALIEHRVPASNVILLVRSSPPLLTKLRTLTADPPPLSQTFSVASADDLKAKLQRIMPDGAPEVKTHHAFALSLLRGLPGSNPKANVIGASAAKKLLRTCQPASTEKGLTRRIAKSVATARASGRALPEGSIESACEEAYKAALCEARVVRPSVVCSHARHPPSLMQAHT